MILAPCIDCGDVTEGTRCDRCRPQHPTAGRRTTHTSTRARGYDTSWRKLSERARRQQPWCLDCGATDDLTADHSPEAWARHDAGLPIRLADVDVVCRRCNTDRGAARGDDLGPGHRDPGGMTRALGGPTRGGEAKSQLHTPGGYVLGRSDARGATNTEGVVSR